MSDWRHRAQITNDVVFFRYVPEGREKEQVLVHVWDLDKTYLETQFETVKGLFRAAFEKAFQKTNVPGTASLVRALIRAEERVQKPFPIYFITASPPQLEEKIRQKLELDGIKPYGSFFKDNLKNLKPGRFWRLTKHLGYKLQGLLELRTRLREDVQMILWGDDSENDPIVYSLFSDICARRLPTSELLRVLRGYKVVGEQIEVIFALLDKIPEQDPVKKIYINLAADTDPEYYLKFGRRMVATVDSFQSALDLFQDGVLEGEEVARVAVDLMTNYGMTADQLVASLNEFLRRGAFSRESLLRVLPVLHEAYLVPKHMDFPESGPKVRDFDASTWIPQAVDYLND